MAAPTRDEILEELRHRHQAGDGQAVRDALELCAADALPMPQWLAETVLKAVRAANLGRDDELLGPRKERRRTFLRRRNWAIRRIDEAWTAHEAAGTGVTKAGLIRAAAKLHNIDVKTVEKILYPPRKKPTRKPKK